ncbi:D-sedoheptulose 7-phosphate isomerase [Aliarcobacter butzleri]|uniref:D-sedoheptulose-7-phosphate isomerase n=1 Tax=Aliarcobacter butzleri TaxID=28197 RepID=UPI0024DE89D0|nr:D-sedoheptulose 7-phosphate isomerase [Aliarcobacter butzleri]MDK2084125.1 D-sedoheptulose 7-phosphate isomerase [Aliarcobacter butzleri]
MTNYINNQIEKSLKLKQELFNSNDIKQLIQEVSKKIIKAYKNGNKTLIAGNGGSAADAQHIAGEFVSRFYFDRPGLASIALTTDTSILTAIGNDYGYEKLFSRQLQANGAKGDVFIGISTSGNSQNVIEALKYAKENGIITVGLTGQKGGMMKEMCDYCICMPSDETPRVQEGHILIGHIICAVVEEEIFGKGF